MGLCGLKKEVRFRSIQDTRRMEVTFPIPDLFDTPINEVSAPSTPMCTLCLLIIVDTANGSALNLAWR
jgi:hypothetical protein